MTLKHHLRKIWWHPYPQVSERERQPLNQRRRYFEVPPPPRHRRRLPVLAAPRAHRFWARCPFWQCHVISFFEHFCSTSRGVTGYQPFCAAVTVAFALSPCVPAPFAQLEVPGQLMPEV